MIGVVEPRNTYESTRTRFWSANTGSKLNGRLRGNGVCIRTETSSFGYRRRTAMPGMEETTSRSNPHTEPVGDNPEG